MIKTKENKLKKRMTKKRCAADIESNMLALQKQMIPLRRAHKTESAEYKDLFSRWNALRKDWAKAMVHGEA